MAKVVIIDTNPTHYNGIIEALKRCYPFTDSQIVVKASWNLAKEYILTDGKGKYALPIDESDQRNPIQFLYEEEKNFLLNELPMGEWVNV